MSEYFVKRPYLSSVIAMLLIAAGFLSYKQMPVSLYPIVKRPVITVTGSYPGASASTIADSVIQALELELGHLEGLEYMESSANSNGGVSIQLFFEEDKDLLKSQIDVQNIVSIVEPRLPEAVKKTGLLTTSDTSTLVMGINLFAQQDFPEQLFISNYAKAKLVDRISKIDGVAKVTIFGELDYAMRVWLDPRRLFLHELTVAQVRQAIIEQNAVYAVGKLGEGPNHNEDALEFNLSTESGLKTVQDFENIIVKSESRNIVYLSDVATVEIGSHQYQERAELDSHPGVMIGVYQEPSANALSISSSVKSLMKNLEKDFPFDLAYAIHFDHSKYIDKAIFSVLRTLIEATIIVIVVVFVFLKSWRSAVIPSIVIPVSLVGTFSFLHLWGFSINLVSLLAMVLAIGIVVDDAIIIVERVELLLCKYNMSPYQASIRATRELAKPIVTTTLVLLAAFLPILFMPGYVGELYREFSTTICVSVVISAVCALTLSPALCAVFMRAGKNGQQSNKAIVGNLYKISNLKMLKNTLRRPWIMMAIFIVLLGYIYFISKQTPKEFVPGEDLGYVVAMTQLPDNSPLTKTIETMNSITGIAQADPAVASIIVVNGFNFIAGNGSNNGLAFIILKDWSWRRKNGEAVDDVKNRLSQAVTKLHDSNTMIVRPSTIPGLGSVGGFGFKISDTLGRSPDELNQVVNVFVDHVQSIADIAYVSSGFRTDLLQYSLVVDREKAKQLGVNVDAIYSSLNTFLSPTYINDFTMEGKQFKVLLQAKEDFRSSLRSFDSFHVRNDNGQLVPIAAVATVMPIRGPDGIQHFNGNLSASVNGSVKAGVNLGKVIQQVNQLSLQLPEGYILEWVGQARNAQQSSSTASLIYGASFLVAFALLLGLYESFLVPVACLSVVPFSLFGAYLSIHLSNGSINVYSHMGVLLLIGISAKTALLLMDTAIELEKQGYNSLKVTLLSAKKRMRAILMTSIAFILGVIPLVINAGPGAGAKTAMGFPVLGGMLALVLACVIVVPFFLYFARELPKLTQRRR